MIAYLTAISICYSPTIIYGVAQLEYDLCDDPLFPNFKKLKAIGYEP